MTNSDLVFSFYYSMQPLSDKRAALGRHWDGQPWARAKDVLESNYVMGRRSILRRPHVFNLSGIVSMLKTLVSVRPYSLKVVPYNTNRTSFRG